MNKIILGLLSFLAIGGVCTKSAYATQADAVHDFFISGGKTFTVNNGSDSCTPFFTIDAGNPNSSGSEDAATGIKSQTYTFVTQSDGTFDRTSVVMPSGFVVTAYSGNSLTISKTESRAGAADGGTTSADNVVKIGVSYNIASLTQEAHRTVTLSGNIVFEDGSSKSASGANSGTDNINVEPDNVYDPHDLNGKELKDLVSGYLTPSIGTTNPILVGPGTQISLGIEQLQDDDTVAAPGGSRQVDHNPNASYQLTFSTTSGGLIKDGSQSQSSTGQPSITYSNNIPNSHHPIDTVSFSQSMPSNVTATGTLADTTSSNTINPSSGSEKDDPTTVTWNFQKGFGPPTVAKEDSRTPSGLTSATGFYVTYDLGTPYITDSTPPTAHFNGWALHEAFSNYFVTGFTASNLTSSWLQQYNLVSAPIAQIAQTLFLTSNNIGDSQIQGDQFTDHNTPYFLASQIFTQAFTPGFLSNHTISITVTQQFFCGTNTALITDQMTYTSTNGSVSMTKSMPQ